MLLSIGNALLLIFKGVINMLIKLELTREQSNLVWLALQQAEENAYNNERADIGDALNLIRRELEYNQDNQGE